MSFTGTTDSGHAITLDAEALHGGADRGPRPMELLLIGLGGCTGMDVVSILRKMRKNIVSFKINISAERAAEHPKVYTDIVLEYIVEGDMEEKDVEKAIVLSQERYCSASAMLGKSAKITYSYKLRKAERKP